MPARRSRTQQWRRGLEQIHERGGAIEIAIACDYGDDELGSHLIWRVQILDLEDDCIIVEQPATLGQPIQIRDGVELIGVMTIGQNRWNFQTQCLATVEDPPNTRRRISALRLRMPDSVRRCQRRNFYRMGTASLHLPELEIWPLLDPKSVVLAERASELRYARAEGIDAGFAVDEQALLDGELLPELGPAFSCTLLNIGGGGIGVCVQPEHGQLLARHKLFWMRFALPPEMPEAVCATSKLAHTHVQADHTIYAGMSFDFTYNPAHHRFVVQQICRYISRQQSMQFEETATHRRTA